MFKTFMKYLAIAAIAISSAACTRIPSGYVGVRTDFNRQIELTEIPEGTWKQTVIGDINLFPIREMYGQVVDQRPPVAGNIQLQDADVVYTYNIAPNVVADTWINKPKSWHHYDDGHVYLMRIYMDNLVKNALFNSVRPYDVKLVNDHRVDVEKKIHEQVSAQLKEDKIAGVTISTINVRNLQPPQSLMESYAAVAKSANDVLVKQNEVQVADQEAQRMAKLSQNAGQSIAYMNAQANMAIAEGIKNGKVNTVVVPFDFKGMVNVTK